MTPNSEPVHGMICNRVCARTRFISLAKFIRAHTRSDIFVSHFEISKKKKTTICIIN